MEKSLDDKINKLRSRLNSEIESGVDYKTIYQTSVELDQLIAEYYRINS